METDIFPPETKEEFLSFERDFTGGTSASTDEDDYQSDAEGESDSDDEEVLTESATTNSTAVSTTDPEAEKENQRVCKFMKDTCGCKLGPKLTPCSLSDTPGHNLCEKVVLQ
jgi:hypothetical protein